MGASFLAVVAVIPECRRKQNKKIEINLDVQNANAQGLNELFTSWDSNRCSYDQILFSPLIVDPAVSDTILSRSLHDPMNPTPKLATTAFQRFGVRPVINACGIYTDLGGTVFSPRVWQAMSDFPTRHNYILHLWQNHIERILAEWVGELAVTIYRSREVTSFAQDDTGVDIALSDGQSLRAQYLVGCDGGHSLVRKTAGIDFPGWDPTTSWLIAEVETTEEPKWGLHTDALGVHGIGKMENGKSARIVLTEAQLQLDSEPSLRDVSEALIAVYGTDYGIHSPTWISRFTDVSRQAAAYRERRVLLAGDAAHVHPPMGGQGLNVGVQDAVNLGWKLAQVIKQSSPETFLDTYHAERHPVAARVLRNTMCIFSMMFRQPTPVL